jgi:hypothetical protein
VGGHGSPDFHIAIGDHTVSGPGGQEKMEKFMHNKGFKGAWRVNEGGGEKALYIFITYV